MTQLDLFPPIEDVMHPLEGLTRYHNTTGLTGDALARQTVKTGTQNWLILQFFREHADWEWTPSEVWQRLNLPGVPLTSIRRGITDLTDPRNGGYLVKTAAMRDGLYGKPEGCWRVKI